MKPSDSSGRELDANFAVTPTAAGFELVLESRGGSDHGPRRSRNRDYAPGLRLIIERMAARGMVLREVQIASRNTDGMPVAAKRLVPPGFPMPIFLSGLPEAEGLRLAIGNASAAFGRKLEKGGGNPTKRLRLVVDWPPAASMSAADLERLLASPPHLETSATPLAAEQPTDDPDLLEHRVAAARTRIARTWGTSLPPPPPGSDTSERIKGSSARFNRDPEVLAWVLEHAQDSCEVCGDPAPFERDDGHGYLEVHHIRPLAEGGPDKVDNAVGCCPNCHRRFHHGGDRHHLRLRTIETVKRLIDYPPVQIGTDLVVAAEGLQ